MSVASESIQIENVVASSDIGQELDFETLADALVASDYNPDNSPGLVYRLQEPNAAALVFRSGKIVCTGANSIENVRRRRAEPREAGPYRVVGDVNPRQFLGDDEYPVATARVEIGFQLRTSDPYEYYWFNWIEPERSLLVGWHQDDTHDDLGPVHLQVNVGASAVDHQRVQFIDSHPFDVVEQRLNSLHDAVFAVEWEQRRPVGLDTSASVVE